MRIIEMIADERRLIADLLSELTPEQLATQSLCDPMRRPLGLKREIPQERAEASLRFLAASPREFVAKGRLEGLALVGH